MRALSIVTIWMASLAWQGSVLAEGPRWYAAHTSYTEAEPAVDAGPEAGVGVASTSDAAPESEAALVTETDPKVPDWMRPTSAPAAGVWTSPDAGAARVVTRTITFLAVLGLTATLLALLGRYYRRPAPRDRGAVIQCLGTHRVSSRANLAVYEINQRQFLLAQDQAGIRCLLPLEATFAESLEQLERSPQRQDVMRHDLAQEFPREARRPLAREEVAWTRPPIQRW